ncbi:MAG: HU family DNA-binding protein [Myxococcota bacterium]
MASYSKSDFLTDVAARAGVSKAEAETIVTAFLETIVAKAKEGAKVSWPGFGSFAMAERAARVGRNPQTGAEIQIPASKAMKFTAAKALKDALNE